MNLATIAFPLFVPADRLDLLAKAIAAAPDAVIIDLEDSVSAASRRNARDSLLTMLSAPVSIPLIVRVNAVGTEWHDADLAACRELPLIALMLPKADAGSDIPAVAERVGLPVIALVETARGIAELATTARVASRLAFGSIDYAADLGMRHSRTALLSARSQMVHASRWAGLAAPFDGVTTAIRDETLIRNDCKHAVELGFGGKLLIHPTQLPLARKAFAPSNRDAEWAARVLGHAADRIGAFQLDGEMIDEPVITRARQIVSRL